MRDNPLETYLNDHLAGATAAVALLERCRSLYTEDPLGPFFADLLVEVERDRDVLRDLLTRVGGAENPTKKAAGWLLEKASRVKLREASAAVDLSLLEALDGLALGTQGKRALWVALGAALGADDRFSGVDFAELKRRAERQHARIEVHRIEAAQRVFSTATAAPADR